MAAALAAANHRILIVEDDRLAAMSLESLLEISGWSVVATVARLDEALDVLRSETIDVALLDVNLQGRPVFPLVDELASRGIPYVFLTGLHRESLPLNYRQAPVLTKPVGHGDLTKTLETAVEEGHVDYLSSLQMFEGPMTKQ